MGGAVQQKGWGGTILPLPKAHPAAQASQQPFTHHAPTVQAICKLMADCQHHLRLAAAEVVGWETYGVRGLQLGQQGEEGEARQEGAGLKTRVELERALNQRIHRTHMEVSDACAWLLLLLLRTCGQRALLGAVCSFAAAGAQPAAPTARRPAALPGSSNQPACNWLSRQPYHQQPPAARGPCTQLPPPRPHTLQVGSAPRTDLEAELAGTSMAAQSEPKVLLARHVVALAHADLTGALDSLHHYFDYAGRGQVGCVGGRVGQGEAPRASFCSGWACSVGLRRRPSHAGRVRSCSAVAACCVGVGRRGSSPAHRCVSSQLLPLPCGGS